MHKINVYQYSCLLVHNCTVLNVDSHLMLLKEAIWDARAKWRDIGLKLKVSEGDLATIHGRTDADCLHEVLVHWMHTGRARIDDLLKALESKVIGHSDIAKEICSWKKEDQIRLGLSEDAETSKVSNYYSTICKKKLAK